MPPKLSLCMIVKNEEAFLPDCLKSVQGVVDEIIVVDTGSEDRTPEIARQFGAKVYHFDWCDDFAAARNACLQYASGDWILQLDADERLDPASKPEVRRWLNNTSKMCVNVLIDSPKAQHKKGHISRAHRLFRNVPGIRYSGRIHEQISPSVAALNGKEGFSNIMLHHLGYAKSEAEMAGKSRRNYELLCKQVQEEPDNAYWHFTLAQNLILNKRYDEASDHLQQALTLGGLPKDIRCSIFNNLAEVFMHKGEHAQAVKFAQQALAIAGAQTTSYLLLFEIYGRTQDAGKQIHCLQQAIDLVEKKQRAVHDVSLEAYVDLAALYINLGHKQAEIRQFEPARMSYERALELAPDNVSARRGLVACHMNLGNYAQADKLLQQLSAQFPDDSTILQQLGWLAIKLQDFERAIEAYKRLLAHEPANTGILKRLAGLYHKLGDQKNSRKMLLRMRG